MSDKRKRSDRPRRRSRRGGEIHIEGTIGGLEPVPFTELGEMLFFDEAARALEDLGPNGGTWFLREAIYILRSRVRIPKGVRVVGALRGGRIASRILRVEPRAMIILADDARLESVSLEIVPTGEPTPL